MIFTQGRHRVNTGSNYVYSRLIKKETEAQSGQISQLKSNHPKIKRHTAVIIYELVVLGLAKDLTYQFTVPGNGLTRDSDHQLLIPRPLPTLHPSYSYRGISPQQKEAIQGAFQLLQSSPLLGVPPTCMLHVRLQGTTHAPATGNSQINVYLHVRLPRVNF